MTSKHTSTNLVTKGGDGACILCRARFSDAVTHAKPKISSVAEAGNVGLVLASELLSLAQHVGDANLLHRRQQMSLQASWEHGTRLTPHCGRLEMLCE